MDFVIRIKLKEIKHSESTLAFSIHNCHGSPVNSICP